MHQDQLKQDKSNFGSQAPIDKETTSIFVGEDKLIDKIHIESKWKEEGIFVTSQN